MTTLVLHLEETKNLHQKVERLTSIERSQREHIVKLKLISENFREEVLAL